MEEQRRGTDLKGEVIATRRNKYDIDEKTCLFVATLLKIEILADTVKIKNITAQTKYCF